jgi:hypothetical protein
MCTHFLVPIYEYSVDSEVRILQAYLCECAHILCGPEKRTWLSNPEKKESMVSELAQ